MKVYLVGGAVRDKLLNYPSDERDWVVVGANADQMTSLGYTPVGNDFPVFLHPKTHEEYALARTERKSGHGYNGFTFYAAVDVTLEEDLARRDLTINAIAQSDTGELIDPYRGQEDLKNKILRHVSPAFTEDPLRILRVARFAARYRHLGFVIAEETMQLMRAVVDSGEVKYLVAERVWKEFSRALGERSPQHFIEVLRYCDALKVILPELDQLFGVSQNLSYHPEIDTGLHTIFSLKRSAELNLDTQARFAVLMHDLGKGLTPQENWPNHTNHEQTGAELVKNLCKRLKVPNDYRELAILTAKFHTHCHRARELSAEETFKLLSQLDALRRPDRFQQFLLCCQADVQGRLGVESCVYPQKELLLFAFNAILSVSPAELVTEGFKGMELGAELRLRRIKAIEKHPYSWPQ
ncbi:MAG: tRNA nucleotidyltransferase (CCA-adding enzyme) [Lentisphaeria bacterium]|jgi:tRNA nucleotidyltransferase (CCA-adding enzyme)